MEMSLELIEKQKQIKEFLDGYRGDITAPVSLETRKALAEAIKAKTEQEFYTALRSIQPHQLGILDVAYNIALYYD